MASITYTVAIRDSTIAAGDNRKTGLTPTWVFLKRLSDNADVAQPSITEIAQGQYKFAYDAESLGEAAGQIDAGATLANPSDRYLDILLTRDSSRIVTALPDAAPASAGGLPTGDAGGRVELRATGLDQIGVADPGGIAGMTTFPKMMVALWRRAFKKSVLTKTATGAGNLETYADDGTTVRTTSAWTDDGTTQVQGPAT